jgi:hypothetical protein
LLSTSGSFLMPFLSGKYDPKIGPLISAALIPPGPFKPGKRKKSGFPGLIDTAVLEICIAPDVAAKLSLTRIGKTSMVSATHETPMNVNLVDLIRPFGTSSTDWIVFKSQNLIRQQAAYLRSLLVEIFRSRVSNSQF